MTEVSLWLLHDRAWARLPVPAEWKEDALQHSRQDEVILIGH
jgi:hypothetical protein